MNSSTNSARPTFITESFSKRFSRYCMAKIYLYLARRDKKGLRLISVLDGPETQPVRLRDVKLLNLPRNMEGEVARIVHDNRMYWEPWLESAASYEALKMALRTRGYRVPSHADPMYLADRLRVKAKPPPTKAVETMLRKTR